MTTNDVPLIVIACCVLHEIHHSKLNSEWLDSIESTQIPQPNSTATDDDEPSENASEKYNFILLSLLQYSS